MATTYEVIATTTLGSSAASYTFSSIPQTYTDLVLVIDGTPNTSDSSVNLEFNSDTTSANYPSVYAYGNGSSTGSGSLTSTGSQVTYFSSANKGVIISQIMNYTATDKYKTVLARQSTSSDWAAMWAGTWKSTSAITQIKILFVQTRTWNAGSTFTLYGIKAA